MKSISCFYKAFIIIAFLAIGLVGSSKAQCPLYQSCLTTPGNPCGGIDDNGNARLLQTQDQYGYCFSCAGSPIPPVLPGVYIGISSNTCHFQCCGPCLDADTNPKFFHIRNLTGCGPMAGCGPYGPPPTFSEVIEAVEIIGTPTPGMNYGDPNFPIFRVCQPLKQFGVFQSAGYDFSREWRIQSVLPIPGGCTQVASNFDTSAVCDTATAYQCGQPPSGQRYFRVLLTPSTAPGTNVEDMKIYALEHLTFVLRGMDQISGVIIHYSAQTWHPVGGTAQKLFTPAVDTRRIASGHCWDCIPGHEHDCTYPNCNDNTLGSRGCY
ncbi:MAG TPA: hypothetical protein VFO76_01970 [Candidatus Kapabacteria bacterium]|nr:hypothetical protein [Candidatus Kapabacteria bacterium]